MTDLKQIEWKQVGSPMPLCRAYISERKLLRVFVGREPGVGWHLSISHPYRYPTWDEIKAARYQLVPDEVTMAMLLPPSSQFVNVHSNCFHLYEQQTEVQRG